MPVHFYDPGGKIAAAARAQATLPPRTAAKPAKPQPTQHGDAFEYGLRLAAKAPVREQAPPPQKAPSGAGGLLGRGLGMVLNNPIVRTVTRPLDVLDVPRRAVWSTINEVADAFNGGDASFSDWYDQTNPFHVITQKGDTSFGAGSVLPEVNTSNDFFDKWVNRGIGLAGDVIGDPLTYVGGLGFVPEVGTISSRVGRMTRLEEGVSALEKTGQMTDGILEGAKKVAQTGNWGHADPLLREAAQVSDTAGVHLKVPFSKTMQTGPLPGTRAIGNKLADVVGGVKGGINASDWGARRIASNVPEDLSNSLPRLLSGNATDDKFRRALETIPFVNAKKAAQGRIEAIAAKKMNKTVRQVKDYLKAGNTVDDLIRHTEDLNSPATPLNTLADDIRKEAARIGVDMPEIQDIGYFPHVLSKEFKDMLANGGDDAQRFLDQSGIISKELTGDSGFLQGRKLRPTNGKPLTITLDNGRSVTLTEGTVEEINAKMKELFPKLKGTALETDPRTALERYITSVSSDIGNRAAEAQRLKAGSQLYGTLPSTAPTEVLPEGVAGPAGQAEGPFTPPGHAQTVARGEDPFANDRFFKGVRDEDLSKVANEQEAAHLAAQAAEQSAQADVLRRTAAGDISRTAKQVQGGLDEGLQGVQQRLDDELAPINAARADINTSRADLDIADIPDQQRIEGLDKALNRIGELKQETVAGLRSNTDEIRRINTEATQQVADLKQKLKSVNSRIGGFKRASNKRIGERKAAWLAGVEGEVADARAQLAQLQEEAAGLRVWDTQSQDRLNYAIADEAISNLNNEIKAAQAQLDEVTSLTRDVGRLGHGRPPQERIDAARRHLETNPNVKRYDEAVEIRDAAKAGEAVDPQKLAEARKYLRTKAARNVPENRKILESVDEIDRKVGKQVAGDPEVRAAKDALANAEMSTKRKPAYGQTVGNQDGKGIYVGEEELKRLFPERNINTKNMYDVPFTEYLQRLRRSYGSENTLARGEKLKGVVRMQQEQIDRANAGLVELFHQGDRQAYIEAVGQAQHMWRTMPEQMLKQQYQEQIISIPARAQVQMETLDVANTNLRQDYKRLLLDKEERQGVRDTLEAGMQGRQDARANLDQYDAALQGKADVITEQAGQESTFLNQVRGVHGKRSMDPLADLQAGKNLSPTKKALKNFDLQTDPALLQPMNQVLNDIKTMARFDPNMTDDVMGATESLLMQHRQALRNVSGQDLTVRQTEQLLREANSGRLLDVVAGQLRDQWTMLPGRGDTVIDAELNRMLTNLIQVRKEPGAFGRTLTAFTNFFKTYATLTPGFHIRNAMSAVFMNTVDGVPLRTQREGLSLWRQWEKAEEPGEWLSRQSKEVQDAFDATFASGAGGRFFESGVAESTASTRSRFKEGVYRNRVTTASQKAGEQVEGSVRLGMALDSTRNGASVASAYDRVARIHFDYASVSKMDEQAKKMVPFWTYTSRNLPMQISEMWKKPKVYAWYNSFVRNFEVDPAEFTPEYFESAGAWNTGEKVAGMPLYLQPDLPHVRVQEDLDRFTKALQGENVGQVLSDVNPFFTAPIEYTTGQDLYTGTQYKPTDYSKAEGFADKAMLPLMRLLNQTKEGADGTYIQDKGMNAMRALIPVLDRSVRLVPGSSGSSGDPDRQFEAWARTVLAAPIRTLSPAQQRSTQRGEYFDKLDEQAMQRVLAGGQP